MSEKTIGKSRTRKPEGARNTQIPNQKVPYSNVPPQLYKGKGIESSKLISPRDKYAAFQPSATTRTASRATTDSSTASTADASAASATDFSLVSVHDFKKANPGPATALKEILANTTLYAVAAKAGNSYELLRGVCDDPANLEDTEDCAGLVEKIGLVDELLTLKPGDLCPQATLAAVLWHTARANELEFQSSTANSGIPVASDRILSIRDLIDKRVDAYLSPMPTDLSPELTFYTPLLSEMKETD